MAITEVNLGTLPDGVGGDTPRSAMVKINSNFTNKDNAASRQVGLAETNVMEVGAFGWGGDGKGLILNESSNSALVASLQYTTRLFKNNSENPATIRYGAGLYVKPSDTAFGVTVGATGQGIRFFAHDSTTNDNPTIYNVWTSRNTSVDANGAIKSASPIIKLFADKIELNDEAKEQVNITFEKLDVGDYLIKGSTGFAQEGWYIETPKDANGNVLVAVVYEQLKNNDIRVKTYSKMVDKITGDVVPNTKEPKDIPPTRWIDIRLNELPDITA